MSDTLCWSCTSPGTGRCCWDRNLTPVPGWTAKPTTTDGFDTFEVIKCPLFEKTPPRKQFSGGRVPLTEEALLLFDQLGASLEEIVLQTGVPPGIVYARRLKMRQERDKQKKEDNA